MTNEQTTGWPEECDGAMIAFASFYLTGAIWAPSKELSLEMFEKYAKLQGDILKTQLSRSLVALNPPAAV